MKTVQVVIDERLLHALDRETRKAKTSRSAFVREAIRDQLKRRRTRDLEEQVRRAYRRFPDTEFNVWDKVTAWPED